MFQLTNPPGVFMRLSFLLPVAMLSVSVAHADTVFDVNLTTYDGGSVTGTVTFNTALTAVQSGNLFVIAYPGATMYRGLSYAASLSGAGLGGQYFTGYYPDYPDYPYSDVSTYVSLAVSFVSPGSSSLARVTGNLLTVGNYPTGTTAFAVLDSITSGTLVAETPEPSTLALFGTGLLGGFAVLRRRAKGMAMKSAF